jgi:hypothetical protein
MKPDSTNEPNRRSHPLRNGGIAVLALMLLYVLSVGPAVWLTSRGFVSGQAWKVVELRLVSFASLSAPKYPPKRVAVTVWAIYKPLCWAYNSSPDLFQAAFDKYLEWWHD